MITIKQAQIADFPQWDKYVEQHQAASPYHRSAWLVAVKQAYQHKFLAWLALNESQEVVGVLPSVHIKPPMSNGKLSALPFCDLGGVLANNQEITEQLLQQAHQYCQSQNIQTFEHRQSSVPEETSLEAAAKVRMLIDMPEDADAMFTGFKSKLRSQIRKAEKNGLTASTGRDKKHLDGFYHVFARNMRDLGSPVHSKKWFEAIIEHYQDNIVIANVYKEQEVVGAGIVLFNGENACIPWASTNADFNRLAPNMLLYWTLLADVANKPIKTFDFGRSTPGEGTYKFKQQWGAAPVALTWQTYQKGQLIPEEVNTSTSKARALVETIWKKLPVKSTVTIGPQIRKYISL